MKTILSLLSLSLVHFVTIAQCSFSSDYSSNSGWTQVGSNVDISNGKLNYFNGSADGQQRRVYKNLGFTLDSNNIWSVDFDFTPKSVGSWGGPATGHTLFALTAGTQEPFNDCPNISCTGYPNGNQDGLIVNYVTTNPTDPSNHISNTIFFKIYGRDGGIEYASVNSLTGTTMNTDYYLRFERLSPIVVQLSVFSDSNRTAHLPNSPISLAIPSSITGLNTVQHGNTARGDSRRRLTGSIDNLCINNVIATSISKNQVNNLELVLFPNPAKKQVSLKGLTANNQVQLFNIGGQLVLETTNQNTISISDLSSGVYFVQVRSNGSVYTQKLIVE